MERTNLFSKMRGNPIFTGSVWGSQSKKVKTLHYQLNHPSQVAKSHAGKAEAITQRALNKIILPKRKKEKFYRLRKQKVAPHRK